MQAAADGAYVMADEILTRMNTIARQRGITLPDRQIIYPAAIPEDCEQVAIMLTGWQPTVVGDDYGGGCLRFKWAANFSITIIRCSPAIMDKRGKMPTAEAMNESGLIASNDSDILVDLVNSFTEFGPEFALVAAAPEGGFQGVQLTVSLPQTGGLS